MENENWSNDELTYINGNMHSKTQNIAIRKSKRGNNIILCKYLSGIYEIEFSSSQLAVAQASELCSIGLGVKIEGCKIIFQVDHETRFYITRDEDNFENIVKSLRKQTILNRRKFVTTSSF